MKFHIGILAVGLVAIVVGLLVLSAIGKACLYALGDKDWRQFGYATLTGTLLLVMGACGVMLCWVAGAIALRLFGAYVFQTPFGLP